MNPWIILSAVALLAYILLHLLRPALTRWGATGEERSLRIPGLDYLAGFPITSTHAVTIEAPAAEIWPWLVQMGSGRGGCYSYSWMENLVGCRIRNADRILPEFQDLKRGDPIVLHPKAPPVRVAHLERDRVLALDGWVFHLRTLSPTRTRLLTRTYRFPLRRNAPLIETIIVLSTHTVLFDLLHFIMGRRQLLEIKRLVEGAAAARFHTMTR